MRPGNECLGPCPERDVSDHHQVPKSRQTGTHHHGIVPEPESRYNGQAACGCRRFFARRGSDFEPGIFREIQTFAPAMRPTCFWLILESQKSDIAQLQFQSQQEIQKLPSTGAIGVWMVKQREFSTEMRDAVWAGLLPSINR